MGVTFGWVVLAQKTIDYISILSQHHLNNKIFTFKLCPLAWNGIIQNDQRISLKIIKCTIPEPVPETRVFWSNPTRTRPEVKKPYLSWPVDYHWLSFIIIAYHWLYKNLKKYDSLTERLTTWKSPAHVEYVLCLRKICDPIKQMYTHLKWENFFKS